MSFDVNLPKRHRYPNYTYGDISPLCLCKWTRLRRLRGSASEVKVIGSGGGQKTPPILWKQSTHAFKAEKQVDF